MRASKTPIPQRPHWKQSGYKDIVRDIFQFRESLPLPIVTYPHDYGTWIVFQERIDTQPYLCSCHRDGCIGFLRLTEERQTYRLPRNDSLVNHFLPGDLGRANTLRAMTLNEFETIPLFRDRLCHLCNRRVPPVRWTNADEQSIFLQHFGWYHRVACYAAGLSPCGGFSMAMLDTELRELVEVDPTPTRQRLAELFELQSRNGLDGKARLFELYRSIEAGIPIPPPALEETRESHFSAIGEMRRLQNTLNGQTVRMKRLVEERLRRSLGFPAHGKTGGSELILFWIVSALFSDTEISHHAHPSFLGGLELDIFIPSLQLAIEYQGEQHYEPFSHLGGARHLRQVRQRDAKKVALCKAHGIDLRFFTVADKLTENHVANRLSDLLMRPQST